MGEEAGSGKSTEEYEGGVAGTVRHAPFGGEGCQGRSIGAVFIIVGFLRAFLMASGKRSPCAIWTTIYQRQNDPTFHSAGGTAATVKAHAAGGACGPNLNAFGQTAYAGPAASCGNGFSKKVRKECDST